MEHDHDHDVLEDEHIARDHYGEEDKYGGHVEMGHGVEEDDRGGYEEMGHVV